MSYIEQDVFLFNTTIWENITLGENFTDELLERAIKGSSLDGDLSNMPLGLDTPVGENGSNLSGGQKQRVAIARALIHKRKNTISVKLPKRYFFTYFLRKKPSFIRYNSSL